MANDAIGRNDRQRGQGMAQKMVVEILAGPPGSGKSTKMREEVEAAGGRYLIAYPTIPLLREQAKMFRATGKVLAIEAHSKSRGKGTVQRRLTDAAKAVEEDGSPDVVVLTTHESLMGCDLSAFKGWHFRIDEAPNAAQGATLSIPVSRDLFKAKYRLSPINKGNWHEVSLINEADRWTDVADDDLAKPVAEFMKQAARPTGAFVDVSNWDVRSLNWCALWSPHFLEGIPASLTIAGASYAHSIGAFIAKDHVSFHTRTIPMARSTTPTIRIHYFTQGHRGSSKLWSKSEGRKMIVKVCDYLSANVPDLGYWSGNNVVKVLMEHRLPGEMIDAKAQGRNEYRDRTSCAFIFSSKPTPNDESLKTLTGITDAQIERAREEEDVLQFVMRGAIRDRDFGGDYDIYLYTKKQADDLAAKLNASKVGMVVTIPITAAGILNDDAKPKAAASTSSNKAASKVIKSSRTGKNIKPSSEARNKRRAKSDKPKKPVGRPRKVVTGEA